MNQFTVYTLLFKLCANPADTFVGRIGADVLSYIFPVIYNDIPLKKPWFLQFLPADTPCPSASSSSPRQSYRIFPTEKEHSPGPAWVFCSAGLPASPASDHASFFFFSSADSASFDTTSFSLDAAAPLAAASLGAAVCSEAPITSPCSP